MSSTKISCTKSIFRTLNTSMPLPLNGPISAQMIQAEFGGPSPFKLSNYYRGGAYVPNTSANASIPTSGPLAFSMFYGASAGSQSAPSEPALWFSPQITYTADDGGQQNFYFYVNHGNTEQTYIELTPSTGLPPNSFLLNEYPASPSNLNGITLRGNIIPVGGYLISLDAVRGMQRETRTFAIQITSSSSGGGGSDPGGGTGGGPGGGGGTEQPGDTGVGVT